MQEVIQELLAKIDQVITTVEGLLPSAFPEDVSGPIFDGIRNAAKRIGG